MVHRHQTSACHCSSALLRTQIEATGGYPLSPTRASHSEKPSNGRPLLPLPCRSPMRSKVLRRRRYKASTKRSNPSRMLLTRPGTNCQMLMRRAMLQNNVRKRFETIFRNSGWGNRDHHYQVFLLLPQPLSRLRIPRVPPNGVSNSGMEAIQPQVLRSLR